MCRWTGLWTDRGGCHIYILSVSSWSLGGVPSYSHLTLVTEWCVVTVCSFLSPCSIRYGEVININLVRDKKTGKSKGFCFLAYEDQRSTVLAVDNFNGIKVRKQTPQLPMFSCCHAGGLKFTTELTFTIRFHCSPAASVSLSVIISKRN